jgi:hypothetical protein
MAGGKRCRVPGVGGVEVTAREIVTQHRDGLRLSVSDAADAAPGVPSQPRSSHMPTDIENQLAELRAIAKSLWLMAEPLLDAAPKNGQARRRERDDLITNLRLAEGRIVEAMQWIRIALTTESARATREATRADEAERERDALVEWACVDCGARFASSVQRWELSGVTRCSSCAERDILRAELTTLRASLSEAIRLARMAANTWACVARTKRDLDFIHKLHRDIDTLAGWDPKGKPTPCAAERPRHGETRD